MIWPKNWIGIPYRRKMLVTRGNIYNNSLFKIGRSKSNFYKSILTINYDRTNENSNNAVTAIYMCVGYLVKEVLLV
jgi:hypothetical protein